MALAPSLNLVFTVTRRQPVLVVPAKPTPKDSKELSDLDDQHSFRFHVPITQFYGNNHAMAMKGSDPVQVIKEALAETLVYYYPLAGRLREGPDRKLIVDCTGEGVVFTEGYADVSLHQFGDALHPPFPCLEELLPNIPNAEDHLKCPLLFIQVTRLKCGGFIFAIQFSHTVCDGAGIVKFMTAVGEMARGASAPSVLPVWQRELLNARNPPQITCTHHEYDQMADTKGTLDSHHDIVQNSFSFDLAHISALNKHVPPHLKACSTFELISACLWRCRTIALQIDPLEKVRFGYVVDVRTKFDPPLSPGYYGNVVVYPAILTTAGELYRKPLGYALELVRKIKIEVTKEYTKSVIDLMVLRDRRPKFTTVNSYIVSDLTRAGFNEVDFGWGKAAYGGSALGGIPEITSFYIAYKNKNQEDGFVVQIFLPAAAMKRFIVELDNILHGRPKSSL